MAKWTDYTTDTNPTDTDEVMTLDADKSPKANKRVTLSTLADYFLDKLASKVFAKLETQNQTVIGALNELNSNWSSNFHTSWRNGNGKSIFDIFTPGGTCGIYSYYNIADIPSLKAKDAYVSIIKGNERMLVITEENIYITSSHTSAWDKKWREISSTLVS